jgi:hypothetical protein
MAEKARSLRLIKINPTFIEMSRSFEKQFIGNLERFCKLFSIEALRDFLYETLSIMECASTSFKT